MICDHPVNFQIFSQIFDNYQDIHDALPVKQWYVIIWYTSYFQVWIYHKYQHIYTLAVMKWYMIISSTTHFRVKIYENHQSIHDPLPTKTWYGQHPFASQQIEMG
jgi:hypothetical protein